LLLKLQCPDFTLQKYCALNWSSSSLNFKEPLFKQLTNLKACFVSRCRVPPPSNVANPFWVDEESNPITLSAPIASPGIEDDNSAWLNTNIPGSG